MKANGVRQVDLAPQFGITQAHLSRILTGTRVPSLELAVRIANLTGIPVASLLPSSGEAA